MDDPHGAVLKYLHGLPTSIRFEILAFVLIFGFDEFPSNRDLIAALDRHMSGEGIGGLKRLGATLRAIAATDYVLVRSLASLKDAEWKIPLVKQQTKDNDRLTAALEQTEAGREFRLRHTQQAHEQWLLLRSGILSQQSLMGFEDTLLRPQSR
jgi:hypothetical protein